MNLDLPYRSLRDFLEKKGLLNSPESVITNAKQEWYRMYQKAYKAVYDKCQINCVLSQNERSHVQLQADKHSMKVTAYIRHLITNDMKGSDFKPNQLIDIEIRILEIMDDLALIMSKSSITSEQLKPTYLELKYLITLCS